MSSLPLENVRILSLGMVWAVPHCTRLLADLGAEVIKVESIQTMDLSRGRVKAAMVMGGYPDGEPGDKPYNRRGVFHQWNRNKLGITLDLTRPDGVEIFKKLAKISDVVASGFPPRTLERFGITYEILREFKPDIIMLAMPAYGATGPESNYVAFGVSQEQMSGLIELTGYIGKNEAPMKSGIDYGDPTAGTLAAGSILAALRYHRQTGKGQFIDISQCEATSMLIGEVIMEYTMNRRLRGRIGNRHPVIAPQGCYRCQGEDKWVAISVPSDEVWAAFCHAIGDPPWTKEERFSDVLGRHENHDDLDEFIGQWTINRSHYEVMDILQKAGVPAGAVLGSQERRENPHLQERGFFLEGTNPEIGTHFYQGPPMKLSKSPIIIRNFAPALGEHNEYVLCELLGYSREEVSRLEREQIIGNEPLPGADRRQG